MMLDGFDMSGFAYGVQTGYIYDITKNIEFEFGLNYTKHDVDKTYSETKWSRLASCKSLN